MHTFVCLCVCPLAARRAFIFYRFAILCLTSILSVILRYFFVCVCSTAALQTGYMQTNTVTHQLNDDVLHFERFISQSSSLLARSICHSLFFLLRFCRFWFIRPDCIFFHIPYEIFHRQISGKLLNQYLESFTTCV